MTFIIGDSERERGGDGYIRKFADNTLVLDQLETIRPSIDLSLVLSTQSLVMQILLGRERSVVSGNKRHMFAATNGFSEDLDDFYDQSVEEYLACRVAKVDYDQWKMRIRFRSNIFREDMKRTSFIDDYLFDWLKSGNLQAWTARVQVDSREEGTVESWTGARPIQEPDIHSLHERMQRHIDSTMN